MPATLRNPDPLTRLNSVQGRGIKVQVDSRPTLTDLNHAEILSLIRETLQEVGLKQEAAAAIAGVKPSQFSAALHGQGNFGATWLWAQDDAFLLKLIEKVIAARALTPEQASAVRRQRIVELIGLLLEVA